ncbi:DUF6233 domain-containing protein [Streptomyces sp. NPDC007264]|uniref:DUF6233 domain-containing protein n=1 Tax=Streptomyces sp. NPDC007264 TaxID=3364777 RepID=UPI0036D84E08
MNERSPSRLELLRFARRVVAQQATTALTQLDRWIADEERRETERRTGDARHPRTPEWLMERGIGTGSPPARIHRGDCHMAKGVRVKAITEEQARRALYACVAACPHCNPDTALQVVPE